MFGAIKSLFFKNKNAIAENIWSQIGIPINIAKRTGTYKDFNKEFFEDDYLVGYFNGKYMKTLFERETLPKILLDVYYEDNNFR